MVLSGFGKNRKKLIRIAAIVLAVLAALIAGVLLLRKKVAVEYGAGANSDIESAIVTVGNISTTVSGSGTLEDEDVEDIELLSTVEIKQTHVSAGDKISDGLLLASVDMPSVLSAMSALQSELDSLDDEISDASGDTASNIISASVTGRVKAIYVAAGDDVSAVMYEHGSLITLSLDGYMAIDFVSALPVGSAVSVTTSDGAEYEGSIASVSGDIATALISDNGPLNADTATVFSADGEQIGHSELYIHQPLKITGYAGTVSAAYAKENTMVYSGSTLIYLTDTSYTATYDALLKKRGELEASLQDLIVIYKEGAIYSHISGSVKSVTENLSDSGDYSLIADSSDESILDSQVLMSICPDKTMTVELSVDEANILALSVGQEATVTVDSIGDGTYSGSVSAIEGIGTSSNGVTRYAVTVTLNKAENMLSGMTASVTIRIEGVDDALLIPSEALFQTSSNSYVYTTFDETTGKLGGMAQVTAGLDNGSYVEISSGLSEGDTVYYTPEEQPQYFGRGGFDGAQNGGMPGNDFGGSSGGGMSGSSQGGSRVDIPGGMPGGMPGSMG